MINFRHVTRKSNPTVDDKLDETLICLVPELCNMTGLTDEMRDNHSLMKDLCSHMKITPNQRYLSLKNVRMQIQRFFIIEQ